MDDILIPTITTSENLTILKEVLLLLRQYKFQLNRDKCLFLKSTIEYLGYVISSLGISVSPRHVGAIKKFPQPRKLLELQRFVGLTNYFRKFIEDYAVKVKPLIDLLKKSKLFVFDEKCVKAFQNLKDELISSPVLCTYNPFAPTEIHIDASAIAIAGMLLQKQESNKWAPVAYFSQ